MYTKTNTSNVIHILYLLKYISKQRHMAVTTLSSISLNFHSQDDGSIHRWLAVPYLARQMLQITGRPKHWHKDRVPGRCFLDFGRGRLLILLMTFLFGPASSCSLLAWSGSVTHCPYFENPWGAVDIFCFGDSDEVRLSLLDAGGSSGFTPLFLGGSLHGGGGGGRSCASSFGFLLGDILTCQWKRAVLVQKARKTILISNQRLQV